MTNQPIDPPSTLCASGVLAALERIRHEVRDLSNTLWAHRRGDELMDIVAGAEALRSTIDALVLGAVDELEATHAVKPVGWASTQDLVTAVAGGHKGLGAATVRLAEAFETRLLAPVGEAMCDGWLSSAKAQVIRSTVDELPGDAELRGCGLAVMLAETEGLDATELPGLGGIWCHGSTSMVRHVARSRSWTVRNALPTSTAISRSGSAAPADAGSVAAPRRGRREAPHRPAAALQAGPQQRSRLRPGNVRGPGCGHDRRDPRDHGARMWDTVMELRDRAAAVELLPESHGATPRVSVTIDLDDLTDQTGSGTTETGEDLHAATVRRMACDADLIPIVLGSRGEVLDVDRNLRLASAAIWKALVARARHCRFPHCTRPPVMCHAHHLVHWCDGGETSLVNMELLCGHHHRLIHAGPWQIRPTGPNDFEFDPRPAYAR